MTASIKVGPGGTPDSITNRNPLSIRLGMIQRVVERKYKKTFSTIEKVKVREATASLVRDKGAQGSEAKLQIGLRPTARRHDGWLA